MAKATLNKQGITTKAGDMTVYNYDGETREYLTSSVEFLALGVGIPANSCTDAPVEEKEGFAVCRAASLDGWEYVADHRGETVYDTETGQPANITAPGDYAVGVTTIAPSTPMTAGTVANGSRIRTRRKTVRLRRLNRKIRAAVRGAKRYQPVAD